MTRPVLTARLKVMAANIESRKRSPELLRQIELEEPDVVIVEQAYYARRFLRGIGGYHHRQYHGPEASGIAVLVKHGVRIERRRPLRMTRSWIGPKAGHKHPPRTYPALRLVKSGVTFRVLGIHFPTHNNKAAQAESEVAVAMWFSRNPAAPAIAAGDWNRLDRELADLADECDAELLSAGKVDHALVAATDPHSRRRLPTPEGAHGWALYTIQGGNT